MTTIKNYVNPYDKMPPPPERFRIGRYVVEELKIKDGKLVFPKGMDNICSRSDFRDISHKKIKAKKNTNFIESIVKNATVSKIVKTVVGWAK